MTGPGESKFRRGFYALSDGRNPSLLNEIAPIDTPLKDLINTQSKPLGRRSGRL
jgi:hypothetical protein